MINSIRISQKLSGALTLDLSSTRVDDAVVEERAVTVPIVAQGHGSYIVDDTYLSAVQTFIASVATRRPPVYVRFDTDGAMIPAPKDAASDLDDEPGGPKP